MKNVHQPTPRSNPSISCAKKNCQRRLPSNHPAWYTNGLCKKHFYSIDCSSSDDDEDESHTDPMNPLPIAMDLSSSESSIISIQKDFQAVRGDIRETREIFNGQRW